MILNEIELALQIVIASVLFSSAAWAYIEWKHGKEELRQLRENEMLRAIDEEKKLIHKEYDEKSLDSLIDSSSDIYSKLGTKRKDN